MSKYRSDTVGILCGALAKAQGCYKVLTPNEMVASGRFANLEAILDCTREALSTNGLAFYQFIELLDEGSGASLLNTILSHSSGEFISSCARITPGNTFRETFNCVEAYRRLNALLILGIAPSPGDPLIKDDNGLEEQDKAILKNLRKPQAEIAPASKFADKVTNDQYNDIMQELEGFEEIAKGIHEYYNVTSVADLPKDQYFVVQARIRKLKKTHEEYNRR
jgi:hypothetical protein